MPKYRMLHSLNGSRHYGVCLGLVGDVVEMSKEGAAALLAKEWIEPVEGKPERADVPPPVVETGPPETATVKAPEKRGPGRPRKN